MSKKLKRRLFAVAAALLIVFSLLFSLSDRVAFLDFLPSWQEIYETFYLRDKQHSDKLKMTVLDAGDADCLVITMGGKTLVVDAGETSFGDDACRFLLSSGVSTIDYLIATHPHADHIGGMAEIVKHFPVKEFLMPRFPENVEIAADVWDRLDDALNEKGVKRTEIIAGLQLSLDAATVTFLSPQYDSTQVNLQSAVCRITYGDTALLLMGDAERRIEMQLLDSGVDLRADVIKIGHHGGDVASTYAFLDAVSPSSAVITCSGYSYDDHPNAFVLERLNRVGATVYRSDKNGRITVLSDGKIVTVTTEKQ